jgi:hypothetical protein
VLIPGGFILTAAHCINWSGTGRLVLGDHCFEDVTTADGRNLLVSPYAIEVMSDLAVLGVTDGQVVPNNEDEAFEDFCSETEPTPLFFGRHEPNAPFPVYIRAHTGDWIEGIGQTYRPDARGVHVHTRRQIQGGTSGGPIVTADGLLIGVTSNAKEMMERDDVCDGSTWYPHLHLPEWLLTKVREAAD